MTTTQPSKPSTQNTDLVEMNWDPITRIVGSLGIYTKIDFKAKRVAECHSTSSIFRGYSIFMKGKDPRDAHFITSRICGICGDNHATCSVYNQNMAYGVRPPHLAEWIINLGEAAEYMFDHNIFQENLVGVDFCEKMVGETNPGVLEQANRTEAPHAGEHGYKTIGDIMRSLNPLAGEFYREALQVSRSTREMFCLMEGRHVHPSTLYPGGVGTVATVQLFTDYLTRLMRYVEFMKRVVPMHDDLFDFFYEALPGYEEVGRRRVLLGCWGSLNNPEYCDFTYQNMESWGRKMFVTPGVVVDGKLVTTAWSTSTWASGSCSAPRSTRTGKTRRCSSPRTRWATRSTAGTRGTSTPSPARPSGTSTTSTAGRCPRAGSTARTTCRSTPAAAPSPGSGQPPWRAWSTAAT
jgi:hydrogenase large subunit